MNAKKFLSGHFYLTIRVEAQLRKIDEMKEMATAIGSFDYSKDRVVTFTPANASYEAKVIRIVDLEKDIQDDIAKLKLMRERIVILLSDLSERDKTLMTLRYLNHMKWREVAEAMNYEEITVKKRNAQILIELDSRYEFKDAE